MRFAPAMCSRAQTPAPPPLLCFTPFPSLSPTLIQHCLVPFSPAQPPYHSRTQQALGTLLDRPASHLASVLAPFPAGAAWAPAGSFMATALSSTSSSRSWVSCHLLPPLRALQRTTNRGGQSHGGEATLTPAAVWLAAEACPASPDSQMICSAKYEAPNSALPLNVEQRKQACWAHF